MSIPSSIMEIKDTLDYVDAFLIGIKGLCVNMNCQKYKHEVSRLW